MNARKAIRSAVAVVLFSILIVAFAISGVTDDIFNAATNNTAVITAGGRQVSPLEFKREFENRKEQAQQQAQRQIGLEELVSNNMHLQLMQMMANEQALQAVVEKDGVTASPQLIVEAIRDQAAFFDPITGRFDKKSYEQALAQADFTPKLFETKLGEQIGRNHFLSALQSGFRTPLIYGAFEAAYALERRDSTFIFVDPTKVGVIPTPTDAQLQTFLEENKSLVMKPELRQLTFARFSVAQVLPSVTVDPAEVQKIFDFRKDQLSTAETRTLVQIPAKDAAAAKTIADRLAKGEDPAAIAKSVNTTVISYDNKPKTAIPDRKVADAAFALTEGATSAPIQGELGFAVVKVSKIVAGQTMALDTVRDKIVQEVKGRAAQQKVSEAADKFDEAHAAGADLIAAAKTAGGQVFTTGPIASTGSDATGKVPPGLTPKLVASAFKLPQGGESEFEAEGPGEYFIVRVDKVLPPALPTVEEIRPLLTKAFMSRELERRLKAKGDELAARARKGESMDAIAASIGTKANHLNGLDLMQADGVSKQVGAGLVQSLLNGKKGEVVITTAPSPGLILAKVDAIFQGQPEQIARQAIQGRAQIGKQLTEEVSESAMRAAAGAVKVKTYPDRARAAVGAAPLPKQEAKTKSKDKAG